MPEIEVECILDRENDSVTIVLHDIPMDRLQAVLEDVSTSIWRNNVIDGIRGQFVIGESWGVTHSQRRFNTRTPKLETFDEENPPNE